MMTDRETLQARIEAQAVAADDDQAAFESLARAHPHAAYATDPERFLAIGREIGLVALSSRTSAGCGSRVRTELRSDMEGPMELSEKIEAHLSWVLDHVVSTVSDRWHHEDCLRAEIGNLVKLTTDQRNNLEDWREVEQAWKEHEAKLVAERDALLMQVAGLIEDRDALRADPDRTSEIALGVLKERDALREQLERLVDWHKHQANSEGGIVQQIKDTLRCARPRWVEASPAGWTDQSPRVEYREREPLDLAGALEDWEEPHAEEKGEGDADAGGGRDRGGRVCDGVPDAGGAAAREHQGAEGHGGDKGSTPTGEGLRNVPGTDDLPTGEAGDHYDGLADSGVAVVPPV